MTEEQLRGDLKQALTLPHGKERIDAFTGLIRQADLLQSHSWRKHLRWRCASEQMGYGDQGKVFPLVAEYVALCEVQEQTHVAYGDHELIFMADYGMEVLNYLPQIPLSKAESVMAKFEELLRFQGWGLRCFYQRAFLFYRHIDIPKALELFQKFKETRRDFFSDCRACEQGDTVRLFLHLGDWSRAEDLARPIWDGALKCHNIPRLIWQLYLDRALDFGDQSRAATLAESLFRTSAVEDPSDLGYIGTVLRCWALTDLERGMDLLERCLSQWKPLWDRDKWFDFLLGAWSCCRMRAREHDRIPMTLPQNVPFHRSDGLYSAAELADWFHDQAKKVASQFDRRNGTEDYASRLERAEHSMDAQDGQRLLLAVRPEDIGGQTI